VIGRLRKHLAGSATYADREGLAQYCVAVIRNYILHRHVRRRFGFDDPFDLVATDVADMETGSLLDTDRLPSLRGALRRGLVGEDPREVPDDALDSALRSLLQMRGHQGLEHEWVNLHHAEALLLRCLRAELPHVPGIRLTRDARGRLVRTEASNLGRAPISREEITFALSSCASDLRPRAVGVALVPILAPNREHGGYCFLMDLVRTVHSIRAQALHHAPSGTGAVPSAYRAEIRTAAVESLTSQIRNYLMEEGRRIDRLDLDKDRRRKDRRQAALPAGVRAARVEIAVQAVIDENGLEHPGEKAIGLSERVLAGIPEAAGNGDLKMHVNRTYYILERLRERLHRAGPLLLDSMWQAWWIGP
jgi:hypothetical protein